MTDQPCTHQSMSIDRDTGGWLCTRCRVPFLPMDQIDTLAAEKADMAVAVASAMLWDFHQRAVEAYGAQVAEPVAPDGIQEDDDYMYAPDEPHDH